MKYETPIIELINCEEDVLTVSTLSTPGEGDGGIIGYQNFTFPA